MFDQNSGLISPGLHFLNARSLAVKSGDNWKFFDPATTNLPPGMLRWQEEGAAALLSDSKEGTLISTPMTAPEASQRKRRAVFVLAEDGTLEGKIQLTYTGHAAIDQKNFYDQDSPEKRQERIRDLYKGIFPEAQVDDIRVDDNIADASKPFSYSCRLKVPGYAQRTGKRLLLQPAFFQAGRQTRYPQTERKYDIDFDYPWSEDDAVEIALPDGFQLDNASAPPSTEFGPTGEYKVSLGLSKGDLDRKLIYSRKLVFGREGTIIFPKTSYSALKKAFDFVHEQDNHMVSLKVVQ